MRSWFERCAQRTKEETLSRTGGSFLLSLHIAHSLNGSAKCSVVVLSLVCCFRHVARRRADTRPVCGTATAPFLATLRDFRFGSVSHVGDLSRVWSLVCSLLQCQLVKQVLPCYSAVLCQIWFDSILLRSTCGHERTKLQRSDGFNLCSESVALSVGRPLVEVLLFSTKAYFNLSHRVTKVQ